MIDVEVVVISPPLDMLPTRVASAGKPTLIARSVDSVDPRLLTLTLALNGLPVKTLPGKVEMLMVMDGQVAEEMVLARRNHRRTWSPDEFIDCS